MQLLFLMYAPVVKLRQYVTCIQHVTVKTFPKIGAFFCKGLPAYMPIVHATACPICVVDYQQHK